MRYDGIFENMIKTIYEEKNMQIGLAVQYDGKENFVFLDGVHRYPVGSIVAEYARLQPYAPADAVLSCPFREEERSRRGMERSLEYIRNVCRSRFGRIASVMFVTELFETIRSLFRQSEEEILEFFHEINEETRGDKVREYILSKSGLQEFHADTIGGVLDYAYYAFVQSYAVFKMTFCEAVKPEEAEDEDAQDDDIFQGFLSMYVENTDYQKIDYKLMLIDGTFSSVFIIRNSISLLLFEVAHLAETGGIIKRCANCGEFFVPVSDEIYCNEVSPQNKEKLCIEIGGLTAHNKFGVEECGSGCKMK